MKHLHLLLTLLLVVVLNVGTLRAQQVDAVTFITPLSYTGSQWQVKSSIGPIYLARLENGHWRVLACFDGTAGKYFLDWQKPNTGVYAAIDGNGSCSETVSIGDDRNR